VVLYVLPCRNIFVKLGCGADRSNHQSDVKCIFIFIVGLCTKQNTKFTIPARILPGLEGAASADCAGRLFSSVENLSNVD
jgi:hypothetical protein